MSMLAAGLWHMAPGVARGRDRESPGRLLRRGMPASMISGNQRRRTKPLAEAAGNILPASRSAAAERRIRRCRSR